MCYWVSRWLTSHQSQQFDPKITRSSENYQRIACGGDNGDPTEDDLVEADVGREEPHDKHESGRWEEVGNVD